MHVGYTIAITDLFMSTFLSQSPYVSVCNLRRCS